MTDIFVSYASQDLERVKPLVTALEERGWGVWWDRELIAGPSYHDKIEEALDAAHCVVVVWSSHSVASQWVKTEANEGLERGILVPLLVDDVKPPLAFRIAQTARMTEWPAQSGQLGTVLDGIADLLGEPVALEQRNEVEEETSIAVLPFEDMSAEQDQHYLGRGIAEEMINGLTRLEGLRVASRTSSFHVAGQDLSIPDIAAKLKVRHILEGSIRKAGNRVRITMQLIDAEKDAHLLSDTYDRDLDDLFAVQDDIANQVVKALKVKLGFTDGPAIVNTGTDSVAAFEVLQQAKEATDGATAGELVKAEQLCRSAIDLDPTYTFAYRGCAIVIGLLNLYGIYSDDQIKELKRSLLTSWIKHHGNDESDRSRYTEQLFRANIDQNVLAMEESLRYLILQDRNEIDILEYADVVSMAGEYQVSQAFAQHTVGTEAPDVPTSFQLGNIAANLDDLTDARVHFAHAVVLQPSAFFARYLLARTLLGLDEVEEAALHLRFLQDNLGGDNFFNLALKLSYESRVRKVDRNELDFGDRFVPPFYRGLFVSGEDIQAALMEWEKALDSGSAMIPRLRGALVQNWIFDGRRLEELYPEDEPVVAHPDIISHPDMQAFLAKMGIDDAGCQLIRQRALGLAEALGI